MIVFYTENKKALPVVSMQQEAVCSSICTANCIKPKNKCCNKYQKKGINCKRCPLTFDIKIAS